MDKNIVILAAGKGSRMKSNLPKVLQPLASRPLLSHVFETAKSVGGQIITVIGHGADQIKAAYSKEDITWVMQEQQLGTGHAVAQVLDQLSAEVTLILYGDVPLIKKDTLNKLIDNAQKQALSLLTIQLNEPKGYGRIVRSTSGKIEQIVEEKDASPEQKSIHEVNTGILAIKTSLLKKLIPLLKNDNAQQEYYLTDIVMLAVKEGVEIGYEKTQNFIEVQGVNDKQQLTLLERAYQLEQVKGLQEQGATIIDAHRLDIRGQLNIGQDVTIDVNCVFAGEVNIGNNVSIGPNCVIGEKGKKVIIADNVEIKAFSIIESATIGTGCVIGPYARLRPGTHLHPDVKIGNFVETKNADIGQQSKVNHLSYIGDANIGEQVNIGAGTITCNYDGVNKYVTTINDNAFIGSNTSLIAPIVIGKNATVGAGSVINKNVDDNILAVTRAKQNNIEGWPRPRKK